MRWLIQDWILQLLRLRDRHDRGDAAGDLWWMAIRERILIFLINTHSEPTRRTIDEPGMTPRRLERITRMPVERTFCAVEADDHPPRVAQDLADRLNHVRRLNEQNRAPRRWRWWF